MSNTTAMEPSIRSEKIAALDLRYQALRVPPSPVRRVALAASLERHGQQQPVLVSDAVASGRLVLLDGFKRVEMLRARGVERVTASVAALDGAAALAALAAANAGHQSALCELEEAWLIAALQNEHGLRRVEIATLLGRHPSWVCRRLSLHEKLERAVADDVRLGLVSVSAARELARLPRGNQAAAAKAVSACALSWPQTTALVSVLLGADPEARREILEDPVAHLPVRRRRARATPSRDARLGRTGNEVRVALLAVHGAAERCDEVLRRARTKSGGLGARDRERLAELAPAVLEAARAALGRVEAALVLAAKETADAW